MKIKSRFTRFYFAFHSICTIFAAKIRKNDRNFPCCRVNNCYSDVIALHKVDIAEGRKVLVTAC